MCLIRRVFRVLGWILVGSAVAAIFVTWLYPQWARWETPPYGEGGPDFADLTRSVSIFGNTYSIIGRYPRFVPYYQSAPVAVEMTGPSDEQAISACVEVLAPSFAVTAPREDVCFRQVSSSGPATWRVSLFPDSQALGTQEVVVVTSFRRPGLEDSASFPIRIEVRKGPLDRTPALAAAAFAGLLATLLTVLTRSPSGAKD